MTDEPRSPADCVAALLGRRHLPPGAVVVDLTGQPGTADAVAALGLVHLVAGAGPAMSSRRAEREVEVVDGDLSSPDALFARVSAALGPRTVAGVLLGDVLARVADPGAVLDAVHRFCLTAGDPPVVVHVPNVTHLEVGTKLLIGRWDEGDGELLARDHVRHFSQGALSSLMAAHDFAPLDADDVVRAVSDQHFPADAVPLERTTMIGAQLAALREAAGGGPYVIHFVRLYAAVRPAVRPASSPAAADADGVSPFLSVLLRTQGRRWETLEESLLCLAAQSCDDFEVLVLLHDATEEAAATLASVVAAFHPSFAHRVRVLEVRGGGRSHPLNEGARAARGRYLAMLDDDDVVFAHWVESFRAAAARRPGRVVRVPVATQEVVHRPGAWDGTNGYEVTGRPRLLYSLEFDHVDHVLDNRTPNNGYAVPRPFVVDLGQGWDESLPVLEDWDHLMRAASFCGVESVPVVTALVRSWREGEDSKSAHAEEVWESTRRRVVARFDALPLVLAPGSFSEIRKLAWRLDETGVQLLDAHHRIHLMQLSSSWRLARPLRFATRAARRVMRAALRRARTTG
ncbi:MAG: glycosyltransferase family A protein [Acidimicrobiales bacterium]